MFARLVSMDLKPDSAAEFTRTIDNEIIPLLRKQKGFKHEVTFVTPNGTEAVGISLWDDRENAQAYYRTTYPQVLGLLSKVIEGIPVVMNYEVADSTLHKIADRAAAVV
jgi:heme-degrading monooxygenase HmoA